MGTANSASNDLTLDLDINGGTGNVTITMTCPSDVWCGVGFNASAMADAPYTITVEPNSNATSGITVTERRLENHMPGSPLQSTITVLSNQVHQGQRMKPSRMNIRNDVPLLLTNNVNGSDNDGNIGAKNWQDCRRSCDERTHCGSWTYLPEHFTTPYNVEKGTCRMRKNMKKMETTIYTSNGWVEGMLSGIQVEGEMKEVRTVTMTRSLVGKTKDYYTFDPTNSNLKFIEAVGTTPMYQYHGKSRGGNTLVLVEVGAPMCVCRGEKLSGSINGIPWSDNCHDWPDTTIKRDHNPSCSIETYGGGMICCHHGIYLLDKEQIIPPQTFKYRMKYRFWYEDPEEFLAEQKQIAQSNATISPSPTISTLVWGPELPYQNAFFMFRETEIAHGEYDVPKCEEGTPIDDCIHVVIGNFQMKDALHECKDRSDVWCSPVNLPNHTFPQSQHVALVHVSPHCHGPACISMEMIDADNNVSICKTVPHYGSTDAAMNEAGYAAGIPPCIWGTKNEGLPYPPILSLNTNITVIKKVNSTVGHRGVMGHWQMRAIWAKDPALK